MALRGCDKGELKRLSSSAEQACSSTVGRRSARHGGVPRLARPL
jgi:hypothetical protein